MSFFSKLKVIKYVVCFSVSIFKAFVIIFFVETIVKRPFYFFVERKGSVINDYQKNGNNDYQVVSGITTTR